RSVHGAVVSAHEHVHAAEFFQIGLGGGIEEAHLGTAVLGGLLLRQQAGGVVSPAFGGSGATGTGTVEPFGHPDVHGGEPGREVRAGGGGNEQVLHLARRPDPEEGLGREHVGP